VSGTDDKNGSGRVERIRHGLRRTREGILGRLTALFERNRGPSPDWYEDLETALIEADLGPRTAVRIVEAVRSGSPAGGLPSREAVSVAARRILKEILVVGESRLEAMGGPPLVILAVGVNGGGKTTTSGKIARRLRDEGKRVVLCAADTFRAGARSGPGRPSS
jgi:fused signal recognition particle receptor